MTKNSFVVEVTFKYVYYLHCQFFIIYVTFYTYMYYLCYGTFMLHYVIKPLSGIAIYQELSRK